MGRIVTAVGCILLIIAGGAFNLYYIDGLCGEIAAQVELALQAPADGGGSLQAARSLWDAHHTYLCAVVDHEQIDQVTGSFQRAMAFLGCQTYDEYTAELQYLLTLLQIIRGFDRPSLRNIL